MNDDVADRLRGPMTREEIVGAYKALCFRAPVVENIEALVERARIYNFNAHQVWLGLLELPEVADALNLELVREYSEPAPLRMNFGAVVFGHVWDYFVSDFVRRNGEWEPEVQAVVRAIVRSGDVCLNVGGHIGTHAALMASLVGKTGAVHAFEPIAHNFAALRRMKQANGFDWLHVYNVAVSDKEEFLSLRVHAANSGGNSVSKDPGDAGMQYVRAVSLDQHIMPSLSRVDFVLIDVEGHEGPVLRGAQVLLETYRPNVVMELAPANHRARGVDPASLVDNLMRLNLQVSVIGSDRAFSSGAEVVAFIESRAPFMDIVARR